MTIPGRKPVQLKVPKTSVETLIKDERLKRLFNAESGSCALQIWLLQIDRTNGVETKVLYARLTPYSFSNDQWSAPKNDNFKKLKDYKAQVVLLHSYLNSNKAADILSKISTGENLANISDAVGLEFTEKLRLRFGEARFSTPAFYRPVSLLPSRQHVHDGLRSPHSEACAFSAALTPSDKASLFLINQDFDKELLTLAVKKLDADTGLSFSKEDVERLGDLELLVFPTLDSHERNLLTHGWVGDGGLFEIKLLREASNTFEYFNFHLILKNNGQEIYSRLMEVHEKQSAISAVFDTADYVRDATDELKIEIYGRNEQPESSQIMCSYGVYFIREMNFTLHNVSNFVSGQVRSEWLTRVTKLSPESERLKAAQSINQAPTGSSNSISGGNPDPWVSVNRGTVSQFLKWLPAKSDGAFFDRYSEGDGLGRLEFVEWIRRVLGQYRKHQILIFDPYFEEVGISLLVPNASPEGDYIVFTCAKNDEGPRRLNDLALACARLAIVIRNIRLRIFVLPEKSFHDRYILIDEYAEDLVSGYHLSNSIQHANESFPLLITPIPRDVLPKVNHYARSVLAEATQSSLDGKTEFLVFDSKLERQKMEGAIQHEALQFLKLPLAGKVLSLWLDLPELEALSDADLKFRLSELGYVHEESLSSEAFTRSELIFDFLKNLEQEEFDRYWPTVGEILAWTPSGDLFNVASIDEAESLANKVYTYLIETSDQKSYVRDAIEVYAQAKSYGATMVDLLAQNEHVNFHSDHKFDVLSWADYYALKILYQCSKTLLFQLMKINFSSIKVDDVYTAQRNRNYGLLAQAVGLIAFIIQFEVDPPTTRLLLSQEVDLLKWFGYRSLEKSIIGSHESMSDLSNLVGSEKVVFLGWMITRTHDKASLLFKRLISELLSSFPDVFADEDLATLMESIRGRMPSLGWSEPWLSSEVMKPLLNSGRVSYDQVAVFWFNNLKNTWNQNLAQGNGVFTVAVDALVTRFASYLLAKSSIEVQEKVFSELMELLKPLGRNIRQPLSAASNWSVWDRSLKSAFWINGFLKWFIYYSVPEVSRNPLFSKVFDESYDLSRYRSDEEWRGSTHSGGEYAIFLKDPD